MLNLRTILLGARAARGFGAFLILGVVGVGLILGAAFARYTTAQEMRRFLSAPGVVTGNAISRSSKGSATYAAQVQF
ncbi:MAG: hypothetical protein ABIQ99_06345, partial [Thermoflexales bacterium]